MEIIGNHTKKRFVVTEKEVVQKIIASGTEDTQVHKIGVIQDTLNGYEIETPSEIHRIVAISKNDLLVECEGEKETFSLYHYVLGPARAEMVQEFKNAMSITADSSYKVWCMNSQEGSSLYNAKTRKLLKSRKLFQNNEDTMFYISVDPEDEFEYAYMKTRLVDGFAEDEMTTKIDADSLEIMESYSVVRPNLVTYPYEMEEDDRNQVYSSHFESFVANNYRNALNLENKIAELAQKLGAEDIEALQKANDQVLQKVISQKMR